MWYTITLLRISRHAIPCNLGCHRATILMLAPCCLVSLYNPITAHILTLTFRNMVTLVVAMEWDFGGFISQFFE